MNARNALVPTFWLGIALAYAASAAAQDYPIVDTGQDRCYDDRREVTYPTQDEPFFGQDAHYSGNQPTYRDNGDGTVTDLVTRLVWQKDPGEKKTFEQAVTGAAACRTGGYDDWRLPSIKELYSLILFNGKDPDPSSTDTSDLRPFINTDYFDFVYGDPARGERVIDSQMATSTKYVSTTMRGNETMFGVNFADGRIKGYPTSSPGRQGGRSKTYYVFYVRGNPAYGSNKFHDNGDRTITDQATGLTWTQLDSGHLKAGEERDGKLDWEQALRWVEELDYAGHSDWRLPNVKELQSLIDYTRSPDTTNSAAIDPIFRVTPIRDGQGQVNYPFYWSGTTHARGSGGDTAAYVAFGRSQGWMQSFRGQYDLLDVHGAGSQRSDPKSGDPTQFPRGRGPQGDVINIYNMVRPVRGGVAEPRTIGPELEPRRSGQRRPMGVGGPGGGDRPSFVDRLDRNGDDKVSREEFDGPPNAFDQLDANGDGHLDEDESPRQGPPPGMEMPPRMGPPGQRPMRPRQAESTPARETFVAQTDSAPETGRGLRGNRAQFLERYDANQDGRVTQAEFDGPAVRFTRLDTDGSGTIANEELPPENGSVVGRVTGRPARAARNEPQPELVAAEIDESIKADAHWNRLPPSFVFILADDMGWTGLSVTVDDRVPGSRSDFYQTPRIEGLAEQGMRFSNAYAPGSMCTPSRAGLLTGKSPALLRMTTPGPVSGRPTDRKLLPPKHVEALPDEEITVAELLKEQGYATAHFGKWHLSGGGPGQHGFDQHDGDTANGGPGNYVDPNPKDVFGITNRSLTFMQEQVAQGKPFYLQLSHYAVHGPSEALESTTAECAACPAGTRHRDVDMAAMTHDLDTAVGMVLDRIDSLGIAENTYVVFMSDNGAPAAGARRLENRPLAGGKATLWEGGTRVPLIVRGPDIRSNTFCHESVVGYDLLPTFCRLAECSSKVPRSIEGISLVPLLLDKPTGGAFVRPLVFHFPHYGQGPGQTPQSSIVVGGMKLLRFHETGEDRLFSLSQDIGEQTDLAGWMPEQAAKLSKQLDTHLTRIKAQLPNPNSDYIATEEPTPATRRGPRRQNELPVGSR